jgi:hypothetical protein
MIETFYAIWPGTTDDEAKAKINELFALQDIDDVVSAFHNTSILAISRYSVSIFRAGTPERLFALELFVDVKEGNRLFYKRRDHFQVQAGKLNFAMRYWEPS